MHPQAVAASHHPASTPTLALDLAQRETLRHAIYSLSGRPRGFAAALRASHEAEPSADSLRPIAAQLRAVAARWQQEAADTPSIWHRNIECRTRAAQLSAILTDIGEAESQAADRLSATMREVLSRAFAARNAERCLEAAEPTRAALRAAVWAEVWAPAVAAPADMAALARWRLTAKPQSCHVAFRDPTTGRYEDGLRIEPLHPDVAVPSNITTAHLWVGGKPDRPSAEGPEHFEAREPETLWTLLRALKAAQAAHTTACAEFNAALAASGTIGKLLERRPEAAELLPAVRVSGGDC